MTWIDKLHKLGVTPLEGEAFSPISDGELKQIEATIGNNEALKTHSVQWGGANE